MDDIVIIWCIYWTRIVSVYNYMSANRDKKITVISKAKKPQIEIKVPNHNPEVKTMPGGFSQFK